MTEAFFFYPEGCVICACTRPPVSLASSESVAISVLATCQVWQGHTMCGLCEKHEALVTSALRIALSAAVAHDDHDDHDHHDDNCEDCGAPLEDDRN